MFDTTETAVTPPLHHPILLESFAIIDREMREWEARRGAFGFSPEEYAIVRRAIHSTADFEFAERLQFGPGAIASGIAALQAGAAIVADTGMVARGVQTLARRTFGNPVVAAVDLAPAAEPGRTRTETGLLRALADHPEAVVAIGNAPTALLALCNCSEAVPGKSETPAPSGRGALAILPSGRRAIAPALVVGAPVGFVGVEASKAALAATDLPQIRADGRKGGSPVAAAIVNALLVLAWEADRQ